MQYARWQCGWIGIGRCKAEDIGVAERFRAESRSERIADDSTNTSVRAAVRFNRAWVVVRFDFEDHMVSSSNLTTPALSLKTLTHQSSLPNWPRIVCVA